MCSSLISVHGKEAICAPFMDYLSAHLSQNVTSGISITTEIPDLLFLKFTYEIANCVVTAARLQQHINIVDQFNSNTGIELM